jgi:hypothetical protein
VQFNVIGQELTTLLDGRKLSGTYHVRFPTEGLADGVYPCQLKVGDQIATQLIIVQNR